MNKHALVTGGSGGIGLAICEALDASGYHVTSIDRVEGPYDTLVGDLSSAGTVAQLADEVLARVGRVDVLVNNVGAVFPGALADLALGSMEASFHLNLMPAVILSQKLTPGMATAGWGRIVNITSRAALGKAERTAYVAAKAGLIGLTRVWALEYAAAGITVNAVGPGPIETPLFAGANSQPSDGTDLAESVPVRRMGKPSEVAHAVDFFASEEAGFVTGQTLYVCGGMTVGANHF
ncbi:SDR family NAD(P)-dependent oxidoreductase [Kocuria rosea]|uniref:SDR family NAD(P)-dependent oxidoreductase n=1 Tax=Kocuria rosea TaxID=1275 RepID=UPI00197D1785|nr:SDR family oxidoreductase [Kocuria rosea]